MPSIEIRHAIASDIPFLMALDHAYTTEFVWQMDVQMGTEHIHTHFRRTRLPRSVRQEYPHDPAHLADDWTKKSGLLVAVLDGNPVGYVGMMLDVVPDSTLINDLVVMRRMRRQGVGTALALAGQDWAIHHQSRQVTLVMQSKNYPALRLAQKLGYEFCGFSDRYYPNQDIALFLSKSIR